MVAESQLQILTAKPFDLIMNWRSLSLTCATFGGVGRVKFLKRIANKFQGQFT
jgi:hypothetical protein